MKYFYSYMRLLCLMMLVSPVMSSGQPCGLAAKIQIGCGTATCGYFADSSGYQPGWIGYKYELTINDNLPVVLSVNPVWGYDDLAAGFNRLTLTVYGTNPTTGDSCIDTYTNIFQATGNAVYPEFDVTVSGNDVIFSGTFKGGPYSFANASADFDFGDGNTSTGSLNPSHTYANPGTKTVTMNVTVASTSGTTVYGYYARTINIGAGASNVEFSTLQDNTICDSLMLYTYSGVPFTSGSVMENYNITGNAPVNGTYTHIPLAEVPGHDFILVEGSAPIVGGDMNHYAVALNDCGIIPDTISGYVFEDLNYNGLREPGEPAMAGKRIYISSSCYSAMIATTLATYSVFTDTAGYYSIIIPHYMVTVNLDKPSGYSLTYPQADSYQVSFNSGSMHSGYNFGLSALSVNLCGNTYLDDNNDSLYAFPDRKLPGVMMTATNTLTNLVYHCFSGINGNYCFELPPGNFVVRPVNWPIDSATFTPDSIIVNAGSGGSFYNRNFGFRSPVPVDFNLYMTSISEARPGFDYQLTSRIYNTGYLKGKGDLVCSYDPLLIPTTVNPVNGIINTASHTITWTTDSIAPGAVSHYTANFNIPASTPLGTILYNSATITALPGTVEYDLTDNSSTRTQTVVGSFDPNDKTVTPAGIGATGDVLHNTELNYLIRFQNTGTASAINVFVADTIDDDLDLNTLVVHRASHNYDLVINQNVLTWRFFNINLPDSNTNEPGSHGYIEYSISPKDGLADGTPISNTAYIYFDYNAPVVTNTTLNTMWSSLVSVEEINEKQNLLVYPNPGRDKIILLPRTTISGRSTMTLYDLAGKKIRNLFDGYNSTSSVEADIHDLSDGVYIIVLRHDGGVEQTKWVKH